MDYLFIRRINKLCFKSPSNVHKAYFIIFSTNNVCVIDLLEQPVIVSIMISMHARNFFHNDDLLWYVYYNIIMSLSEIFINCS